MFLERFRYKFIQMIFVFGLFFQWFVCIMSLWFCHKGKNLFTDVFIRWCFFGLVFRWWQCVLFVIKGSKMQAKSVDRTLNLVVRSGWSFCYLCKSRYKKEDCSVYSHYIGFWFFGFCSSMRWLKWLARLTIDSFQSLTDLVEFEHFERVLHNFSSFLEKRIKQNNFK